MIIDDKVYQELRDLNVKLIPKKSSGLMKFIAFFIPNFMSEFWTTIGHSIYYPTSVIQPFDDAYRGVLEHELVHIKQLDDMGGVNLPDWLWMLCYLVFPVPTRFAWFRWRAEREAYMTELRKTPYSSRVEMVVNALWEGYWKPWPKAWMRAWFYRKLGINLRKDA